MSTTSADPGLKRHQSGRRRSADGGRKSDASTGYVPHHENADIRIQARSDEVRCTKQQIKDIDWRINNLYYIVPKKDQRQIMKLNWCQEDFHNNFPNRSVVLKCRQVGFTTYSCARALDFALFHRNKTVGIIAHKREHANAIFNETLCYMYDNLPLWLQEKIHVVKRTTNMIVFSNGSSIRVAKEFVSRRLHMLVVTEFAATEQESRKKAEEIMQRSMESVTPDGYVILECTSRGPGGLFEDIWKDAKQNKKDIQEGKKTYDKGDFLPFFYPAYKHDEDYYVDDPLYDISEADKTYFLEIERETGDKIPHRYKVWWCRTRDRKGYSIFQEYPNTEKEAFDFVREFSIFGPYIREAGLAGRIDSLPIIKRYPIHTAWDLGFSDTTAIWFFQRVQSWFHFIYCTQSRGRSLDYYIAALETFKHEHETNYGIHFLPHDGNTRQLVANEGSVADQLRRQMYRVMVVERPKRKNESIEAARGIFDQCKFDGEACEEGIDALKQYSWSVNEKAHIPNNTPIHDIHSNFADAFQCFAMAHRRVPETDLEGQPIRKFGRFLGQNFNANVRYGV